MPNPDYVITKVRYDDDHSRITKLRRGTYNSTTNNIGTRSTVSRRKVVDSIEANNQHYTVPPDGSGGYEWGDNIEVFSLGGEKFIRTDGSNIKSDDLGNLPEF